jgi:hypothetical protein
MLLGTFDSNFYLTDFTEFHNHP